MINLKISEKFSENVLKPPCMNFLWNSSIIISYVIVTVQVLTNRCKSKFKTENYQHCMIWPMIRRNRDHFMKKDFLNYTS